MSLNSFFVYLFLRVRAGEGVDARRGRAEREGDRESHKKTAIRKSTREASGKPALSMPRLRASSLHNWGQSISGFFFFNFYLFLRPRVCTQAGEGQGGGDRGSKVGSALTAESHKGLEFMNCEPMT